MDDKIKMIIENLLNANKSNRALLINGGWGTGKTYFIKNELRAYLIKKEYDIYYLSVNGMTSIPDIKKKLITTVLTNSKKENSVFGKVIERFKKATESFDKIDVIFSTLEISDFVKLEKSVFCFDDIERLSQKITISELLGFINSELIENKKSKVVLIGNLSKVKEIETLFEINEKYIDWIYNYEPKVSEILNSILKNFESNESYHNFLARNNEKIEFIISRLKIKNFRIIEFTLENLRIIFEQIRDDFKLFEADLIFFTFLISNESKKGKLRKYVFPEHIPTFISKITNNTIANDDDYREYVQAFNSNVKLLTKSKFSFKYYYIEQILKLIVFGYFDREKLLNELHAIYAYNKILTNEINETESYFLRKEMLTLEEKEFDTIVDRTISKIENGSYSIFTFSYVGRSLLNLSNIGLISLTEEEVEDLLIKNIHKIKPKDINTILKIDTAIGAFPNHQELEVNTKLYPLLFSTFKEWKKEANLEQLKEKLAYKNLLIEDMKTFQRVLETYPPQDTLELIKPYLRDKNYLNQLHNNMEKCHSSISYNYSTNDEIENIKIGKENIENLKETIEILKDEVIKIKGSENDKLLSFYVNRLSIILENLLERINPKIVEIETLIADKKFTLDLGLNT